MDEATYNANKMILKANKNLLEAISSRAAETGDTGGSLIFKMLKMVYDAGLQAVKENTEYECKKSALNKMVDGLTKAEG